MKMSAYVLVCVAMVAIARSSTTSASFVKNTSRIKFNNDSYMMLIVEGVEKGKFDPTEKKYFVLYNSECKFPETLNNILLTILTAIFLNIIGNFLLRIIVLILHRHLFKFLIKTFLNNFFYNLINTRDTFPSGSSLRFSQGFFLNILYSILLNIFFQTILTIFLNILLNTLLNVLHQLFYKLLPDTFPWSNFS